MSKCKGVIVSATTNTCRTLMAEIILRHLSGGRVPVVSGGLDCNRPVSAHVATVLKEIGINDEVGPSKGISRLLQEQGWTFDVMVSFGDNAEESESCAAPSHWRLTSDSGNVSRQWVLWSPRNPAIEHEDSIRKFQDTLYRGEPLFSNRIAHRFRSSLKLSKRWDIDPITPIPMERPIQLLDRHRETRDAITSKCQSLLEEMEGLYGEKLLVSHFNVQ